MKMVTMLSSTFLFLRDIYVGIMPQSRNIYYVIFDQDLIGLKSVNANFRAEVRRNRYLQIYWQIVLKCSIFNAIF